jgi:putative hydrolase of the HAD superfamily
MKCFHHIEILSSKEEGDYRDLLATLGVKPREFLMVGNSLKSDILPVVKLGGYGVHIPFHVTWEHEKAEAVGLDKARFRQLPVISGLPALLKNW